MRPCVNDPVPFSTEPDAPLPTLGDVFPWIGERFSRGGALSVILINASALAKVEGAYGSEAYEQCFRRIGSVIREACGDAITPDDLIVSGETGRSEVVLLLFRRRRGGEFYEIELPQVADAIAQAIARRGRRLLYPYLREAHSVWLGTAAALRNPIFSASTQVRRALEDARADAELNARIENRARREELMGVVLRQDIRAVFEPIVDAKSLTVFGYEALARGPEGSALASPLALFGLAEQNDLVFELDCLCRRAALDGAIDFPEGTKLFVNIVPSAFHDPNFQPDALCRTLERCRLQPTDLVFEISERESIANFSLFRGARDDYGKLGFQFAMDDTGAGYASFEAVLELRPEFVKVDRAFVHGIDEDPARQAVLQGFQTIAEQINARIIGEGLDRLEELQTLDRLGITFGQGWLFGKPTPLRATDS